MKKIQLTILAVFIYSLGFGQISSTVIDGNTNEKIPYVNICIENEDMGTTSNENGEFNLNFSITDKTIVFSSVGYETLRIKADLIKNTVKLQSKSIEIKEVIANPKKNKHKKVIGKIKKLGLNNYFACKETPWMVAKHFDYKDDYAKTPYLKKIRILTESGVKSAKFKIRFYSVDENGMPGDYIYNENIIGVALEGRRMTDVDLSKHDIIFPKNGFFIVFEWLIFDTNKFEFTYTTTGSKKLLKDVTYEPRFATIPSDTENSWIYSGGKWKNGGKFTQTALKNYTDKYTPLAIELTLSN